MPGYARREIVHEGEVGMSLDEYLGVLDGTGRQIRADKRRAIPESLQSRQQSPTCRDSSGAELVRVFVSDEQGT